MQEVTDAAFLKGVQQTFGLITIDLAATAEDAVTEVFISPEIDTFTVDWSSFSPMGMGWLNPPFPESVDERCRWMEKCNTEAKRGARFLVILPAVIDSYWFWEFVQPWATIYIPYPRLSYQGEEAVMMLCAANVLHKGAQITGDRRCSQMFLWNWMTGVIK